MKLIKSFCGVQGRFFQKEPLAAGGIAGITFSWILYAALLGTKFLTDFFQDVKDESASFKIVFFYIGFLILLAYINMKTGFLNGFAKLFN